MGGSSGESAYALWVDASGVVTVAGRTDSPNFPTTSGAYATIYNGPTSFDGFVSRLDPSQTGSAQLVYSTFLGGTDGDVPSAISVDARGVVTVAGSTASTNFPTTGGAYATTHNGSWDVFVSRLDPSQGGSAQFVYSTFLGGSGNDNTGNALSVDTSGVVTVAGSTESANFPTTPGAYDTSYNGGDVFVSRLDPNKSGSAQLDYSTFLGGSDHERASALRVDASGEVMVAGTTGSTNFPTTSGAYDTSFNGRGFNRGGGDIFVSRLDPNNTGLAQLVHSTFLGGASDDFAGAFSVDASGVVMVAGSTDSTNFPTTNGAYDTTFNGGTDAFITRLSMGVAFYADRYELSLQQPGTQNLNLDAGKQHASKSYAIFGSITGTSPGINLLGVHIPLNVDPYTYFTIGSVAPPVFVGFQGTLNANGEATASFNVPAMPALVGFTLHHAYLVFDGSGKIWMASNAVPLVLK